MLSRFKVALGAAFTAAALASPVAAAPLDLTFTIDFYNFDAGGVKSNTNASEANLANWSKIDTFMYDGPLDFRIDSASGKPTVDEFFATGGGVLSGVDVDLSTFTLSTGGGSGDNSWGRTTILDITASFSADYSGNIVHDDGVTLFADGSVVLDSKGPTTEKVSFFSYDGDAFRLIYAAANGDPSILEMDGPPEVIPLPPAGFLLIAGFGGLTLVARRRKQA